MPDISMCANKDCTLRMGCYRYRALPDPYRQSYGGFTFTPLDGLDTCEYYWTLKDATTTLVTINSLRLKEKNMKNQENKQDPDKIMGS